MVSPRLGLSLLVLLACAPGERPVDSDSAATAVSGSGTATGTGTQGASTGSSSIGSASTGGEPTGSGSGSDATSLAATTGGPTTGDTTAGDTTLATTGATSTSTGNVGTSTTDTPGFDIPPEMPIPVAEIPGLVSITFYETTGQVKEYTFLVDGPELNTLLPDPLNQNNRDIQGTSVEFYDVYYSDIDGVFDPLGSYLTIAGSFGAKLPAGGGLNLAEISLNFDNNVLEFGSYLASYVGLGDNYAPGSEVNAIDNDLGTHTTMGNTVDTPDQRLRVTLGFKSSLMPG